MTDCEDLYNARIKAAIEGDYTTWSLQPYCPLDLTSLNVLNPFPQWTEGTTNIVWLFTSVNLIKLNLDTGVATDTGFSPLDFYLNSNSVLGKYVCAYESSAHTIHIFKDGTEIYAITLPDTGTGLYVYISPSGKWIIAKNSANKMLIYKGA